MNLKNRLKPDRLIPFIVVFFLLIYVLYIGISASSPVKRTFDGDLQRNLSQVQSFLDGAPLDDPNYLGETTWYNPLVPSLIALISRVSGVPPDIVNLRAGAYLNILTPIFFFLLCLSAFGTRAAVGALFSMLFLITSGLPTYFCATYSPILYALHLAPFLFFIAFYFFIKAVETSQREYYVLTGLFLGLTFLAHTAPAVILGLVILIKTLEDIRRTPRNKDERKKKNRKITGFIISMAAAFTVSLPFLYSILFHYKMKIINTVPMDFTEELLKIGKLKDFIIAAAPHWAAVLIMILGLILIIKNRNKSAAYRLFFIFTLVVTLLLFYNYLRQLLVWIYLPLIVPSLHYVVYLTVAGSVLFGLGAAFLIGNAAKFAALSAGKICRIKINIEKVEAVAGVLILLVAIAAGFLLVAPHYAGREDFTQLRQPRVTTPVNQAYDKLYHWVLENTAPDDVFLNDKNTPDYLLMAGRKFVVNPGGKQFSNPYVDYEKRLKDRNLMLQALEDKRYDILFKKAREYRVRWIISDTRSFSDYWSKPDFLIQAYLSRWTAVYRLDYERLKKACETNLPPSPQPYMMMEGYPGDVIVFHLHQRNFTAFESDCLAQTMLGWRWIYAPDGPQCTVMLSKLLKGMKGGDVIITKRKILMELIGSGEIKTLEGKRILFCGFKKMTGKLRLQRALPEKVIISSEESRIWTKIKEAGGKIYGFSDGEALLSQFAGDANSFLRYIYAFIYNAEWRQKYFDQWLVKLNAGKVTRADVYHSLLKQAGEIDY